MNDIDRTIPPERATETLDYEELTLPGKRDRKPDGRFNVGELVMRRYKVLAELGQGGMGVVYKCFDETAGIEVALKALPPELSHNTLEMEDIRDNFQLVSKLVHQNIAISKNLEKDPANGNYYLIMECVEGEDLRRWLRRKRKEGELTLDDILPIVKQVADALDYAHKQKIIHRDIKPGNIMINAAGEIKVLDFGLAAQIHTSMTRVSMAYHGTSGTGPYMAPEQWRGRAQGAAADQYALAVIAYEMLSGHLPFESTDPAVLREVVLNDTPENIADIPKTAQDAIKHAMSKNPADRFESCSHFAAALGGKKIKSVNAVPQSGIGKWIAAIIVLAVLGAGVGYYFFNQHKKEQDKYMELVRQYEQEMRQKEEQGYEIITECGNKRAVWTVGKAHPKNSNLISDSKEGNWICQKPGYKWSYGANIEWQSGLTHPDNSNLKSTSAEGQWICTKPGYKWTSGANIEWQSGLTHPDNSNLVSSSPEGQWTCTKPGYKWTSGANIKWQSGLTHPDNSNLVSSSPEGQWTCTKPGYVWTGGSNIEWRAGQTSDRYPHCISSSNVGQWYPLEGYRWAKPKEAGNFDVAWNPGVVSKDGKRKAAQTEGNWLYKTSCGSCGGGGKVSTTSDCWTCSGSGKVESTTSCSSCDSTGRRISSSQCYSCSGSGKVTGACGECGPIRDNWGNILSHHGQICDNCGGRGGVNYQKTGNAGYDFGYQLGMALTGQTAVKCNKCSGYGWYHHSTCNTTGIVTRTCSSCNGSGSISSSRNCYACDGSGRVKTRRNCSSCSNGKHHEIKNCSACSGNGYIWK